MDERGRRVGLNEALFRHVNERIEDVSRVFDPDTDTIDVVCECGDGDCVDRFELSLADYQRVRADSRHFVIVAGHEIPSIEHVVERGDGWVVVEKRVGEAAELAERTNPRD